MSQLVQALMHEASFGHNFSHTVLARFTPAQMREAIQELVGQDRIDMASALTEAGLALHPDSEDVLAIGSLVAMVRQDWVSAIDMLSKLMLLQDGQVQPFTHLMLVRALRCDLNPTAALDAVQVGLLQYPEHADLLAEYQALQTYAVNSFAAVHAD